MQSFAASGGGHGNAELPDPQGLGGAQQKKEIYFPCCFPK